MPGSPVLPVLPTALCPSTTRRRVRAGLRLTERRRGRGKLIPEPGRGCPGIRRSPLGRALLRRLRPGGRAGLSPGGRG